MASSPPARFSYADGASDDDYEPRRLHNRRRDFNVQSAPPAPPAPPATDDLKHAYKALMDDYYCLNSLYSARLRRETQLKETCARLERKLARVQASHDEVCDLLERAQGALKRRRMV